MKNVASEVLMNFRVGDILLEPSAIFRCADITTFDFKSILQPPPRYHPDCSLGSFCCGDHAAY